MKLKNYRQKRPPHICLNNQIYFITVRTYRGINYLLGNSNKQIVLDCINEQIKKFSFQLFAWVIINNHYHLLIKTKIGSDLPKFIGAVNGKSSKLINNESNVIGQKIWSNYFDKCIRSEADFYKHLNYIHQNPIKHFLISRLHAKACFSNEPDKQTSASSGGLKPATPDVLDMQALACYKFCSYKQYLKTKGEDWLEDCFRMYPIIDFAVYQDEF